MNTMGIGLGDYDRDLDLDMALSNIEATALLRNRGDGTFVDVAGRAGVGRPNQRVREKAITWGLAFGDLNLDGWEDLYVVGGSLAQENHPEPQPNATFANVGHGRFADLSAVSGASDQGVGRGLSLADYDRDGRVDLYVVNQGGRPILYRNVTPRGPRHWLEVDLMGTASNRDACGATLVATVGRVRLLRQVFCGSVGLGGGSDPVVHFGLGRAARVDTLRIEWPSGRVQTLRDVAADRLLEVVEPGTRVAAARSEPEDDPWFVESFDSLRPEPPPPDDSRQTKAELRELLRLQRARTPRQVRVARRWGEGPATLPWTRVALETIRTQRAAAFPTRSARALAVLHLGLHDALEVASDAREAYFRRRPRKLDDRIDQAVRAGGTSYPDERAVVAGAAGVLLRYLFPDAPEGRFERLADEAAESRLWAAAAYRSDVETGLALGRQVAAAVVERAEDDGHERPWDFEGERPCSTDRCSGDDEAHWVPTPTAFQYPPSDPMASKWETYLMEAPGQFLPPPPPAYGSPGFMAELEEVKRLSTDATEEEKELAFFWDDGPGTYSPAGHWNDIAIDLVRNRGFTTMETARAFALMNAAIRDAFVATWHAKYHYWSIRPVTAIRRPTIAGQPNPHYDGGWLPNLPTPPFPAYVSGHSAESAAAARVLQYLMPDSGERDKSIAAEMGPAGSIDELAEQAAYSRLVGGIHFRSDNDAGLVLGRRIAALAIERAP
jgi:membrane-associated phospholipid phosphatase